MQATLLEAEPKAGAILDGARRQAGEAAFDRLDRVGRREERVHVRLAKVERHGRDTLGAVDWLAVSLELLDPDGRTLVEHEGKEIAVFRVDGEVHAVSNTCPHEGNPLVEGEILGDTLTCAYHGWRFDLGSGACLHGDEPVRRYPVEVRDGVIRIGVD